MRRTAIVVGLVGVLVGIALLLLPAHTTVVTDSGDYELACSVPIIHAFSDPDRAIVGESPMDLDPDECRNESRLRVAVAGGVIIVSGMFAALVWRRRSYERA